MDQFIKLLPLIIALVNLAEELLVGRGKGADKKNFVMGALGPGAQAMASMAGAEVKPVDEWGEPAGRIIDSVVLGQNMSRIFSMRE